MTESTARRRDLLAFVLFLLLPAAMLGDSLFGGRHYLPFDIAEFPPIADTLSSEQRQELRQGANYDATEPPIWFRSELLLARAAIARGQLPHWNGFVRGGAPMLAHGHMGLLNPLHWPALLFANPDTGLLYLTYTMFALAGALMFGLLRATGLGRSAAIFGGIAFAWSGTLSANGHWFMRMEPLAMLPGLCWALLAIARRKGRARCWPIAGLALATMATWMSGFPQYGIPVTLLAAALGATLCLRELHQGWRPAARLAGCMLLGAGVGLLLAMPQLLQMLQFYPLSNRPIDESLARASQHAWSAIGFLGYVFPSLFSHPGDVTLPQDAAPLPWLWSDLRDWDTGAALLPNYNFTEYALFPGTLPLLFLVLALLLRGPRWRLLPIAGLAALWVMATGAFGSHLAYLLPGIKTVPPYRFVGPACALVAVLAAVGFDALRRGAAPWLLRGMAVALAALGCYCLAESTHNVPAVTAADDPWLVRIVERNRVAFAAARGFAVAEVTPSAALATQFSTADREDPQRRHDAIALGKERLHANLWRGGWGLVLAAGFLFGLSLRKRERTLAGWPAIAVLVVTASELFAFGRPLNEGQALPHAHDSVVHQLLREQRDATAAEGGFLVARGAGAYGPWNLPGGTLADDHIRDLNFYTFVDKWSDLPIRELYGDDQILRGFVCNALPDDERLQRPWWDLVGLRYVLATLPMQHAGAQVLHYRYDSDGQARQYFVYERPNAMPRAWVVPTVRLLDDQEAVVQALVAPDFDPRAAVLVQRGSEVEELIRLPSTPSEIATGDRRVTFRYEDSKRLVLEVSAGRPGYLVVADTFFPGWEVTVNEQPAPLLRGNLSQRVVPVGAGAQTLHFRFRAQGLVPGFLLGGLGAIALVVLVVLGRRKRTAVAI